MVKTILIDMDGVLVDFCLPAMRYHEVAIQCERDFPQQAGYDVYSACKILSPAFDKSVSDFWNSFDFNFWRTLKPYPYYRRLISACSRKVGRDNVFISTADTKDYICCSGKVAWIFDRLPEYLHRQYFIGARKEVFAKPDILLIDDRETNCDTFISAGGNAILVPRPWNRGGHFFGDMLQLLEDRLNEF